MHRSGFRQRVDILSGYSALGWFAMVPRQVVADRVEQTTALSRLPLWALEFYAGFHRLDGPAGLTRNYWKESYGRRRPQPSRGVPPGTDETGAPAASTRQHGARWKA